MKTSNANNILSVHYQPAIREISSWKNRLDKLFLKYELREEVLATQPFILGDGKKVEGTPAIEAYLSDLEQFQKDWYEDRCYKYDFDQDPQSFLL